MSIFIDLVKADIHEQGKRILFDEEAVVAELKRKRNADSASARAIADKQLNTIRARLSELDRLIAKTYEEMVLGDVPRNILLGLMAKYQSEKDDKTKLAATLAEQQTHSKEVEYDIREWVSLMKRYMGVEELDRKLLIKLIDKIIVGQKVIENGEEKQNVTIIYNLVGQVD